MEKHLETIKNSWNQWSETWYPRYRTEEAIAEIIKQPKSAFHPTAFAMIQKAFPDLRGKKICVPSSGDNHAVFSFHLMGAQVTSCDISEKQLEQAAKIAQKHKWDIKFILDDTMRLGRINDNEFDFVYTSNGVHVWINDLQSMYNNVNRILTSNGIYLMFEVHPFMRPLGREGVNITAIRPYDSTGPFGDIPTYKWRVQDIMNAMLAAELSIKQVEEMFAIDGRFWVDESNEESETISKEEIAKLSNWNENPLAALPQWLSVLASK